ncbi:MAG TPA: hypothetical protein VNW52_13110 [Burkholderiaceae bacterium]|nr:hypothetical protein [Burkholderiaceae bacterium]
MNKKSTPIEDIEKVEITQSATVTLKDKPHQIFYADQLAGMQFGPFTTKMTLALANADSTMSPVITVVMPTIALLSLAKQIDSVLSNPETRSQMEASFGEFLKM